MKNKERSIWIGLVIIFIIISGIYFFNTQKAEKNLLVLTKEKNFLSEKIKKQKTQIFLLKEREQKLQNDIQKIKKEKAVALLKCVNEQKKLADKNLCLQEKVTKLKQEEKTLLNTNKEHTAFTSELFQKFLQAENARSRLLEKNRKLALANKKLEEKITIAETERKKLAGQLAVAKKKIQTKEQMLAAVQAEKEKLTQQLAVTQKNIQTKKQALTNAQKEKETLARKIERLKFDLRVCLSVNDRLDAKIAKLTQKKSTMIGEIYFSTGSAKVGTDKLAEIAAAIKKYDPEKYICLLRGAADRQTYKNKSVYRNSQLSARRALAVEYALLYNYKVKLPIIVEGQGNFFAQPPKDNRKERRVEILIIEKEALK